ncbi:hypothetical protein CSUB01_04312 [Colletotrichum sublineola]|uniref:FAM192A/Fyv6 N-terminal domain-containing protein n=1 Tax=Colletotrichum sublineola TaxID=1173701 RepID=A0A066XAN2_COLSU|nr:hypothetical protein CSUB01_04312 [Colletotrichum sublineola]
MSRFVSAGAINAKTGEAVVVEETKNGNGAAAAAVEPKKNAEWEIVQRELEAERKRREEARLKSVEGGERSLYDVLQANKGESRPLSHPVVVFIVSRTIAHSIEFLDEVREAKRAEEERVRRETEEGLAAFRRAQGQQGQKRSGDGDGDDDDDAPEGGAAVGVGVSGARDDGAGAEEEWAVGPRKRRKRERGGFGVKKIEEKEAAAAAAAAGGKTPAGEKVVKAAAAQGGVEKKEEEEEDAKGSPPAPPTKGKLGLVAYGSDSDDD